MKKQVQIVLATVASIVSFVGLVLSVGTLVSLRSWHQLHRLLGYDYVSFADSQAVGGVASDFFVGMALLLIGSLLFTKIERASQAGKVVAALVLVFIAFTLVYACLNPRIGIRPY